MAFTSSKNTTKTAETTDEKPAAGALDTRKRMILTAPVMAAGDNPMGIPGRVNLIDHRTAIK